MPKKKHRLSIPYLIIPRPRLTGLWYSLLLLLLLYRLLVALRQVQHQLPTFRKHTPLKCLEGECCGISCAKANAVLLLKICTRTIPNIPFLKTPSERPPY
ncbi:hypothetical protein QBC45DRAFT_113675 [Copromyces sp. CBS 386.78]|nr:hypothetical protein QBC45DRAFT_113675 [Copromyces sp. CBS 386.78]